LQDQLIDHLKQFLLKHAKLENPFLLAFSGGPDSMALFLLLEKLKQENFCDFEVAHLDHGWRKESFEQAKNLQKWVEGRNIIFHFKKVTFQTSKDLENEARQKRYEFFFSLMKKKKYEALILAHQKEDVIETVLKRVLEGSHLCNLYGMQSVVNYVNHKILRPFLDISKDDLKVFLAKKKAFYIEDETNFSSSYLRGRMRSKILPNLQQEFGKEFKENLYLLSKRSLELKEYWENKISCYQKKIYKSPIGSLIEKESLRALEKLELIYFFKKWLESENIEIKRSSLDLIVGWFISNKRGNIQFKDQSLYLEKDEILLLKKLPLWNQQKTLMTNSSLTNAFFMIRQVQAKEQDISLNNSLSNRWKDLFKNHKIYIEIPDQRYHLKPVKNESQYFSSQAKKHYTQARIPSCLRGLFPILLSDKGVEYDFLTSPFEKINDLPKITLLLQLQ
jgi:tRNA(Ile)-lysidine synthase